MEKTNTKPLSSVMHQFTSFSSDLAKRIKLLEAQEKKVSELQTEAITNPKAAERLAALKSKGYFELRAQSMQLCHQLEHELSALEKQLKQLGLRRTSRVSSKVPARTAVSDTQLHHTKKASAQHNTPLPEKTVTVQASASASHATKKPTQVAPKRKLVGKMIQNPF